MSDKPIKLYLLTGFLGAGKTTFLKRLIDHLGNKKLGIIMNEFGKISVDGVQIKRHGIDITEINNGSIFCSCLKGSFIEALVAYSELPIDYLLVESSGMADPSAIGHILTNFVGKVRGKSFDFRGAVCIVDGKHFLDHVDLLPAIEKQVAASNLVIINKTDLINAEELREVAAEVRRLNAGAEIVRTAFCEIGLDFLGRELAAARVEAGAGQQCLNTPQNRPVASTLSAKGEFERGRFIEFLEALAPLAFRMKGFFRFKEGWHQIDVVGGRIDIKPAADRQEVSQLVIISDKGLEAVKATFENWDKRFAEKMVLS